MYYFKEILHDDRIFIIYRHEKCCFGIFIQDKEKENNKFQLLKFVHNTKQCKEIIKKYKEYETKYGYNCILEF